MKIVEISEWAYPQEIESEHRPSLSDYIKTDTKTGQFLKRNGILLIALIGLCIWTWTVTAIAAHNARIDTTNELNAIHQQELEEAVQAVRDEYAAQRFMADEASRQAQMQLEATWISKVLYGIKDNSERDLRTAVWCVLNRVDNKWYPNSVEEVCTQSSQWMGFNSDNPVLTDLKNIAFAELQTWYSGERPVGTEFVYLWWSPTKITLRDQWQDSSSTNYWRAE